MKDISDSPLWYDLYIPRFYIVKRTYETLYLHIPGTHISRNGYIHFNPDLPNAGFNWQRRCLTFTNICPHSNRFLRDNLTKSTFGLRANHSSWSISNHHNWLDWRNRQCLIGNMQFLGFWNDQSQKVIPAYIVSASCVISNLVLY